MLRLNLIGNLGNDPEMRYSASGSPLLRFNVATNARVKDQAGEWADRTEWVRVTVFGQRAETLGQYLKKGSRVYVDGRLEARPWTTQDGQIRAGLEVIGDTVEFMSSRQDDGQTTPRASVTDERKQPQQEGGNGSDLEDLPF